jgi:hypothetical protein
MKTKLLYFVSLLFIFFFISVIANAQLSLCDAASTLENQILLNPEIKAKMILMEQKIQNQISQKTRSSILRTGILTIPVIFHVIYNSTEQNISDAQIQSQIDVLNEDFNAMNSDMSNVPSCFSAYVGNSQIQFTLAKQDPEGNVTNGITRTYTTVSSFSSDGQICYSINGGHDAWPTDQYLNIWVCNKSGAAGSSSYPWSGNTATDGIIVGYNYVGRTGTFTNNWNFQKGRTITHEIGHWLGLGHIWGDAYCGDDLVSDTPIQEKANGGSPAFPHISACDNGPDGDMFMNYMDYTYDVTRIMFSQEQVTRMNYYLENTRANLLTSSGGIAPSLANNIITIGNSTASSLVTPYGTSYLNERIQFIITKGELETAAYNSSYNTINSLSFDVNQTSSHAMANFIIKISHTTTSSFSNSNFINSYGAITVYSSTYTPVNSSWNKHEFSTPFVYNGMDNILIDISWSNANIGDNSTVRSTTTSNYQCLAYASLSQKQNVANVKRGVRSYSRPNIQLEFDENIYKTSGAVQNPAALTIDPEVQLYPNPISSVLNLNFNNIEKAEPITVKIYSISGVLIDKFEYHTKSTGDQIISINFSSIATLQNLANGIYICIVDLSHKKLMKKFLLSR